MLQRPTVRIVAALGGVAALSALMVPHREPLGLQNAVLVYLLWVLAVAVLGGRAASLAAAVTSFLALNWWFTPPFHELGVRHSRDILTLGAFVITAVVVSTLVDVASRHNAAARRARLEASSLTGIAATMLHDPDPLPEIATMLATTFVLDGVAIFRLTDDHGWATETAAGRRPPRSPIEADRSISLNDDTLLALNSTHMSADTDEVLSRFATQLALAVQGRRLADDAAAAAGLAKANELRNALLAAVSHDLRTPLAAIRASATSLLAEESAIDPDDTRALLETIDAEAERLDALVANLLDMSRLSSGQLGTSFRPGTIDEVVGAVLVELHLHPSRVRLDIPENLPPFTTDATLLQRALANLVDNATRHGSPNHPATIKARVHAGNTIVVQVIDHGRGIPSEARADVLKPFTRLGLPGRHNGVGLGLAVARGFVEAIGGRLDIGDTPGGGATMSISMPLDPDHDLR